MTVFILRDNMCILGVYKTLEKANEELEDWSQRYVRDYYIDEMEVED